MNVDNNNAGQVWARSKQFENYWSGPISEYNWATYIVWESQDYREPIVIHHASMYDYSA